MRIFSALFMEERFKLSILMDYYGNLLTDKQKYIMNLYFNDDLSLSEISELTNTSRQAVYDIIKRCTKLLIEYEKRLCILKKEEQLNVVKKDLLQKLSNTQSSIQRNNCADINDIIKHVEEIISYINENL